MSLAEFEFCEKSSSIKIKGDNFNLENLSSFLSLLTKISNNKKIQNIKIFGNFKSFFTSKKKFLSNQEKSILNNSLMLFQSLTKVIENSPINFTCHLNGLVQGPALELALACDYIKADKDAHFKFKEVDNGLMFIFGSIQKLLRKIGYKNTLELLLFKKELTYQEAIDFKLINRKKNIPFYHQKENIFWDQHFTNTFIYYNSKVHAKTKNLLPAYNAILSSIFEGCLCGYEASLSIEKKWAQWLLNQNHSIKN